MNDPEPRPEPERNSIDQASETLQTDSSHQFKGPLTTGNTPAPLPSHIARYRIIRQLGTGGFGRVLLAVDEELHRQVAIKVPHPERVEELGGFDQYLDEARTIASLDHPNILPVYDVGRTADGLCYVVTKLIEHGDLTTRMKSSWPSHRESARIVAAVAEGLHFAHKKGLVHRDIKPGNILLDSNGNPYVADFGLALNEDHKAACSKWAGTPFYMSPEQARGNGDRVDGRSDVFSLGIVLYELLTKRRPFRGETANEIIHQITTMPVRPPRQRDDSIPVELEIICLKALATQIQDRYTTALDMAHSLQEYLAKTETSSKSASSPSANPPPIKYSNVPAEQAANGSADELLEILPARPRRTNAEVNLSAAGTGAGDRNPRRALRTAVIGISALAILLLACWLLGIFAVRSNESRPWVPQYTDKKPKIIGIYPSDSFGPLRRAGLHALTDEHPEVKVVDLDSATTLQMKNCEIDGLLTQLRTLIENDNVLAIVGPSVTECTKSVLQTVAATGKRIPVFVESAGAQGEIGWSEYGKKVPVFRISSGIDRRAEEISLLISECLERKRPVHLFVESQSDLVGRQSYGEHLYEEIKLHLRQREVDPRQLTADYFPTDDIGVVIPSIRRAAEIPGLIVVLGLGHHYQLIAENIYRSDKTDAPLTKRPIAPLIGWMNAYCMDQPFQKQDDFYFDLLYEITDFDLADRGPRPDQVSGFEREFGVISPAVRDQAFSFDGGYCIMSAYFAQVPHHFPRKSGYYPLIDERARAMIESHLRSELFRGITGDISFGANGQNKDGRLTYARFDKTLNRWTPIDYVELLGTEAR